MCAFRTEREYGMNEDFYNHLLDLHDEFMVPLYEYCNDKGEKYGSAFDRLIVEASIECNDNLSIIAQKCAFDEDEFLELLDNVDEDIYQALVLGLAFYIGLICTEQNDERGDSFNPDSYCVYNIDVVPHCVALFLLSNAARHKGGTFTQLCEAGVFAYDDFMDIMDGLLFLVDGWDYRCWIMRAEAKEHISYYKTDPAIDKYFNEWNYYKTKKPIEVMDQTLHLSQHPDLEEAGVQTCVGTELFLTYSDGWYSLDFPSGKTAVLISDPLEDDLIALMKKSRLFITECQELYFGEDNVRLHIGIYQA